MTHVPVYRDGVIHVLAEKCKTCIFRSVNDGRIMGLKPGRVAQMVQEARRNGSVIPCHSTLYTPKVKPAICKGYYELPSQVRALALGEAMGLIVYDPPPE